MASPSTRPRFLVLVTGYEGAGKSTIAPLLAQELEAMWISRDRIVEMIYEGWEPVHPTLTSPTNNPRFAGSVFLEGSVAWNIFLWMLQRTTVHVPVVADTPFRHAWNRGAFAAAARDIVVPMAEVMLDADPGVLLERARARTLATQADEVKEMSSVDRVRYHVSPYKPVLPEEQVVRVDTTRLNDVDIGALVKQVRALIGID